MLQFIHNGGNIRRIFLIRDERELASQQVQSVLNRQYEIGIELYLANRLSIPDGLRRLMFVEAGGRIGWELFVDEEDRITSVDVTTDQYATRELIKVFNKLLQIGVKRYRPS